MKLIFWYLTAAVISYLLGCINTAAIIGRLKGFDIREKGSGNAGASNALMTMGKGAAVCTTIVDMLKAFLPVFAVRVLIPQAASVPALAVFVGCMVMVGHIFPFWMQFRGGKGFASMLGFTLALDWKLLIAFLLITGVLLLTTKFIALATITCGAIFPIYRVILTHSLPEFILLLLMSILILVKHLPNLRRMKNGSEYSLDDVKHKP